MGHRECVTMTYNFLTNLLMKAQFRTSEDAVGWCPHHRFRLQRPWHNEGGVPGVIDTLEINMRLISSVDLVTISAT